MTKRRKAVKHKARVFILTLQSINGFHLLSNFEEVIDRTRHVLPFGIRVCRNSYEIKVREVLRPKRRARE
jgi:hypothetical protein